MTPQGCSAPLEDVDYMDRYALRVTYQSPADTDSDAKICSLIDGGVLCCVKEGQGTRSLVFEYAKAYKALEDMRRVAVTVKTSLRLISVIVYPKGFACDNCCCVFGAAPDDCFSDD